MIVVDASAILAIHLAEGERKLFTDKILATTSILSPVNAWEAYVRAYAIDGAVGRDKVTELMDSLGIEIVPIDTAMARLAADAFARFGKRTFAGRNLGDCFAHALAKQRNAPLLFKGDDFAKTDIVSA